MAIRCGVLPLYLSRTAPKSCHHCGKPTLSHVSLISHALCCKFIDYGPVFRHNELRDAVARVLRRHGFSCTVEPRYFSKYYTDGVQHRPDLVVTSLAQPIATDFSVNAQQKDQPGVAAAASASTKIKTHRVAVESAGATFIPFCLEAHGYCDNSAKRFVAHVVETRPKFEAAQIYRDVFQRQTVSATLCRARVKAVISACLHQDDFEADGGLERGEGIGQYEGLAA